MIIVVLAGLGLCFGSFVNALVWRIHEQAKSSKVKSQKSKVTNKPRDLSILRGRSMCVNCYHTLAWYDLLPVISWLSLRGKCRYCHGVISWQYPLVELATGSLFVFSYLFWPSILHSPFSILFFALWLIFLVGFMALTVYDLRWMLLPDRIVRPLQVLAIFYVLINALVPGRGWQAVQGAVWGVVFSAGLFYLIYQLSRGKWIGGGDVKLAVVLGLLLGGPAHTLLMIFIASAIGSAVGIPLLIMGKVKQNTHLPFGPFLIAATAIVYLFGAGLIAWYKTKLLIV